MKHENGATCDKRRVSGSNALSAAVRRASDTLSNGKLAAQVAAEVASASFPAAKRALRRTIEAHKPSQRELVAGITAVDLGEQVDELKARVPELEASDNEKAGEIESMKGEIKGLIASKRERERNETKEDIPFHDSNKTEFDTANQKSRAFATLDATLRQLCGPVMGRHGSPQDSASVEKCAVLIGMLFMKYAATLDLDEALRTRCRTKKMKRGTTCTRWSPSTRRSWSRNGPSCATASS